MFEHSYVGIMTVLQSKHKPIFWGRTRKAELKKTGQNIGWLLG